MSCSVILWMFSRFFSVVLIGSFPLQELEKLEVERVEWVQQHLRQYTTLRHETDMFNQSVRPFPTSILDTFFIVFDIFVSWFKLICNKYFQVSVFCSSFCTWTLEMFRLVCRNLVNLIKICSPNIDHLESWTLRWTSLESQSRLQRH